MTDDTQALLKAIDSISSGVIYLPAGTYILTAVINIRKQIVIRGDGQDKTILRFPKSLTDLYGNTYVEGSWVGTSQYSHGTGFINVGGWDPTGRDFTKLTWVRAVSVCCGAEVERLRPVAGLTGSNDAIHLSLRVWHPAHRSHHQRHGI